MIYIKRENIGRLYPPTTTTSQTNRYLRTIQNYSNNIKMYHDLVKVENSIRFTLFSR